MTPASDRNETCPTCGSKDAPRVCCPGTHAPDDHDSTCEPCWDPWHAATPAPRCPYFSRAWGVRCDRPAGHDGACQSSGDVFASGYIPVAAPTPAPTVEVPRAEYEAMRDVVEAVATWLAAEKRVAAAYLRGQIDTETFAKRNAEVADELHDVRIASDALDAAPRGTTDDKKGG